MASGLTINLDDLLYARGIESSRVEFKGTWDENSIGYQVLKTICAFANDRENQNGGYIIIGVQEQDHKAVIPPKGISAQKMEECEKWIRGNCNRIDPPYQPVLVREIYQEKYIQILWVPGSDNRPHRAPDGKGGRLKYWVRIGSESVDAEKNGVLNELLEQAARVPFDDRRAQQAAIQDIRESKVREFLHDISSALLEERDTSVIYRNMRLTAGVNGHEVPRNIGLLFFSEDPDRWFPGARIEVVQFATDEAGDVLEERVFKGGIHEQVKSCLYYLENLSSMHIEKSDSSFRVRGWVSYPNSALREAVVNAVYHRSYELSREPVKVYLFADRIEITSYPGPVPGIKLEHLQPDGRLPPVPARNRRIGEYLKELRLAEGRGTGIRKLYSSMKNNGSPQPIFDFDEDRTYFRVTLPAHPEYVAISALRDRAHLLAIGKPVEALKRITDAWEHSKNSPTLTAALIKQYGEKGEVSRSEDVYADFRKSGETIGLAHVVNTMAETYLQNGMNIKAKSTLAGLPLLVGPSEAIDSAILARRAGMQSKAHDYFEKAGDSIFEDSRALHEFAQTKIQLARGIWSDRRRHSEHTRLSENKRLLREARELLERVLQMEEGEIRLGWTWFDLARVKKWLKAPKSEIKEAYIRAIELVPGEERFRVDYDAFLTKEGKKR